MIKKLCEYDHSKLKRMTEQELMVLLNKMTNEAYNKDYYEVYGFEPTPKDELIDLYFLLKEKIDIKEYTDVSEGKPGERNFFDIWFELWDHRITSQDECKVLYGLCAVSQIFRHIKTKRNIEDDLRIHLCVIMPTATGKSEGNSMLIEFCKITEMKYSQPEEYSPATLIGSFDKNIHEMNIAEEQFENDPEKYPHWRDPVKHGMLSDSNFVIFDEGENILHTTNRTEGAQRILQHAMNRHGSETNKVTNKLVAAEVEVFPNCNIAITSYYQDHFKETLLNRGLLQRTLIFFKNESDVRRDEIRDFMVDKMVEIGYDETVEDGIDKINTNKKYEEDLFNELKNEVTKLRARHAGTEYVMLRKGVKDRLKYHMHQLQDVIPNMSPYQVEIWETMISRLTPSMLKIAALYALVDYREVIEIKDVDKAAQILMKTMQSIAFFMLSKITPHKATDGYISIYTQLAVDHKHQKKSETEWIDTIINLAGISPNSAKKLYKELKADKKIQPRIDAKTGEPIYMLK